MKKKKCISMSAFALKLLPAQAFDDYKLTMTSLRLLSTSLDGFSFSNIDYNKDSWLLFIPKVLLSST